MLEYSADDIYSIVSSHGNTMETKLKVLLNLKQHIKKDFVDLAEVPRYFEALKISNKSSDYQYSSTAFSTICHLVKRVGMQDPNALRASSKVVLPIVVSKLLDEKSNIRQQAKKTLETYWLATPSIVELYIKDSSLIHSNPRIRSEAIIFLSDLIELSKNFNFFEFLPNLVNLLKDDNSDVIKNVEVLLIKYYTLNNSKTSDLVKELKNQKIERKQAVPILKEVDTASANVYYIESKTSGIPKSTIDTFSNITKSRRAATSLGSRNSISLSSQVSTSAASNDLATLLDRIPNSKLDESLKPIILHSLSELKKETEPLLRPFSGKETEFNWGDREKTIIKFRSIISGNSGKFPEELVQAVRMLQDGICKTISSLRTTLSSNGCQLVKELAVYLNKHIDPIAEHLFQPLAALTSSTKRIASNNAYGSLCALLTNTSFNSRILNQCYSLYQDKNTQPRLYSSTFLQIFILKHASKFDSSNMETITTWISKGVADPNTTVRESMRLTFWLFYRKYNDIGERIYLKQDISVRKALDRAKPRDIASLSVSSTNSSSSLNERKRPSVREFVASKRDIRRSSSGPPTIQNGNESLEIGTTEAPGSSELGRPYRIGAPQRIARAVSSGNNSSKFEPLQKQLSKGSVRTESKWPSLTAQEPIERTKQIDDSLPVDDEIELIKKNLKSSLTRERVEGVRALEKLLLETNANVSDLSQIMGNLIILDVTLLKPLLHISQFYEMLDISLSLKILAVNKEGPDILIAKFGEVEVARNLVSLIQLLDSLRFDTAPATMFHIKHKNLLLNFAIQNLYKISLSDNFTPSDLLFKELCRVIFPLSISDYSRYDELVVQLHELNSILFQESIDHSSNYVKSRISSIIEDFKDDLLIRNENSGSEITENALNEMTMINPGQKKATDPTLSIKPGFHSDMTMILPKPKSPPQIDDSTKDIIMDERETDITKFDYMSDIFISKDDSLNPKLTHKNEKHFSNTQDVDSVKSRESIGTNDHLADRKKESVSNVVQEDENIEQKPEINIEGQVTKIEPSQFDVTTITPKNSNSSGLPFPAPVTNSRTNSPFMDTNENDIIDQQNFSDEATHSITDQINNIYISPEKKSIEISTKTNRKSITEIIKETDPFFTTKKNQVIIFEDKSSLEIYNLKRIRRLADFEIAKIEQSNGDTEVSVNLFLELIDNFNKDSVTTESIDRMMKALHFSVKLDGTVVWLKQGGFTLIISSVLNYFNTSVNITKELCFKGLIILKELLIINDYLSNMIDLTEGLSIWNILTMIVENLQDFRNEIYIMVHELTDSLIQLNIPRFQKHVIKKSISLLEEMKQKISASFLLLTLTKILEQESNITSEDIKEIDRVIFKYLSSEETEIRRLTIIAYSKFKRKLQDLDSNDINGKGKIYDDEQQNPTEDIMKEVFDRLSPPERKLVDYYCKN
ncbi:hypothetical protein WICMUC_005018 [Wickerhamomyces mucosus]|uniref:Protein STU1 n=1 Tax=Wickerhamomyces mucosus TaxID=1378264 RepID=A0A9P8PDB3_9ASCO|nr:hypothetical protein WICMUC_005018 [Wickerhamomyces mucosus]